MELKINEVIKGDLCEENEHFLTRSFSFYSVFMEQKLLFLNEHINDLFIIL